VISYQETSRNYCITYVMWRLIFQIHVTVKWRKLWIDQIIASPSHSKCQKRPPSILMRTSLTRMAFCRKRLEMLASAAWYLATRSSTVLGGTAPSGVRIGEHQSELNPAAEKAMQSALDSQSTFLDMLRSTTVGYLPHRELKPCRAQTSTSTSEFKAHLPATAVGWFT
jgi:hypothetical protein